MSMPVPTESFSLDTANDLCIKDAQEYLKKYFIPLSTGDHAFYDNENENMNY